MKGLGRTDLQNRGELISIVLIRSEESREAAILRGENGGRIGRGDMMYLKGDEGLVSQSYV